MSKSRFIPRINTLRKNPDEEELNLDRLQRSPFDYVSRLIVDKYINNHKVEIRQNEYLAVALCIETDNKFRDTLDSTHALIQANAGNGAALNKTIKVRAWVQGLDHFPLPESPSDVCDNVLTDLRPAFISTDESTIIPQPLELIRVTWRHKPGDNPYYWTDPIYLGPYQNGPRRIIFSNRIIGGDSSQAAGSPQSAFEEAGLAQGMIHGADPTLHYDPTPGYPNIVFKRKGSLIDPITIYELSKASNKPREIYVDKESDYSKIKKYDIIPYSNKPVTEEHNLRQYRKKKLAFYLPDKVEINRRKETKMLIIKESGASSVYFYKNIFKNPTMHYTISMNSRVDGNPSGLIVLKKGHIDKACTIRVNVPYGLVIDEKDVFSSKSIGCSVSSPVDGDIFLNDSAKWDSSLSMHEVIESNEFKEFKQNYNQWMLNKRLPDGTKPYILGPFGTPGLRTGPGVNQKASVSELKDSSYWSGRLVWSKWGHYFLPDPTQAEALYELINSIITSPPNSGYSWGFRVPKRHKNTLSLAFPAVGGGTPLYPTSHFIKKRNKRYETTSAFSWGKVGKLFNKRGERPYLWWKENLNLKYKGSNDVSGIVSISRWEDNQSAFLEYYILCRSLGLEHLEAWYVTIAAASQTFAKQYGGTAFGPTWIPRKNDVQLNKYLAKGQKMWFTAMAHNGEYDTEKQVPGAMSPLYSGDYSSGISPSLKIQGILRKGK